MKESLSLSVCQTNHVVRKGYKSLPFGDNPVKYNPVFVPMKGLLNPLYIECKLQVSAVVIPGSLALVKHNTSECRSVIGPE